MWDVLTLAIFLDWYSILIWVGNKLRLVRSYNKGFNSIESVVFEQIDFYLTKNWKNGTYLHEYWALGHSLNLIFNIDMICV